MTTKIHFLCNDQGKPLDFILSGGNKSDIKRVPDLVARNKMDTLLADKVCFIAVIIQQLSADPGHKLQRYEYFNL